MLKDLTLLYFKPSRCDLSQILDSNRCSITSLGLSQTKCPSSGHLDQMMSFEVNMSRLVLWCYVQRLQETKLSTGSNDPWNTMTNRAELSYFACCCPDLMKHIEVSHGFHLKTLKNPLE